MGFVIAFHTILLSFIPSDYLNSFFPPTVALLCVSTIDFIFLYWKHSLNTILQLTNPYKLISRVLHYSWKYKCPERRSALNYWEEDVPSQFHLGMSKFGGSFTVVKLVMSKLSSDYFQSFFCWSNPWWCQVGWEKLVINELHFDKYKVILAWSDTFHLMMS